MRFSTFFSQQARKPTGWFGRWVMSNIFDVGNSRLNRLVYDNLSPQTGDRILEIGSGTGKLLKTIARQTEGCIVEGIDFSDTMVTIARRNNKKHMAKGKVALHEGNIDDMPFEGEMFTKICSINTIYFWPDSASTARKIAYLLKPRGRIVLGFEDIAQLEQRRLDTRVFRFYSTAEVESLLINAGIKRDVRTQSVSIGSSIFHCSVAVK